MVIRISTAWSGTKRKVRPVKRATPIVAVRPGSIPTISPKAAAQNTFKIADGVISLISSVKKILMFKPVPSILREEIRRKSYRI